MAEEPTGEGQVPEPSSPAEPGQVPAPANAAPNPEPAQTAEPWDEARARSTIEKLRAEEKRLKAAAKERDEMAARLKALEDAQLSDEEKRAKAAKEQADKLANLEREREQWASERQRLLTEHAVQAAAAAEIRDKNGALKRAAFHAPTKVFALIGADAIEYDEAGKPTNIDALLAALAESDPYLVKAEPRPSTGATANPGRGASVTPDLSHEQQRQIAYGGSGADMFNPDAARRAGGGVHYAGDKP